MNAMQAQSSADKRPTAPHQNTTTQSEQEEQHSDGALGTLGKLAAGATPPLQPRNVIQLQRRIGNNATARYIQRSLAKRGSVPAGTIQREPDDQGSANNDPDAVNEVEAEDDDVAKDTTTVDQTISQAANVNFNENTGGGDDAGGGNGPAQGSAPSDGKQVETIMSRQSSSYDDMDFSNVNVLDPDDQKTQLPQPAQTPQKKPGTNIKQQYQPKQLKGWKNKKGTKQRSSDTPIGDTFKTVGVVGTIGGKASEVAQVKEVVKSGKTVKEGLDTAKELVSNDSGVIESFNKVTVIMNLPPFSLLLPIASLIAQVAQTVFKYKEMQAFKNLMTKSGGDTNHAKKGSTALDNAADIGAYGFAKTKRGFWTRVAYAAMTFGQIISRLVTMLTGGAAGIVSEAVAVGLGLVKAAAKVGRAVKGLYKLIRGKRGKRRVESANAIVDNAFNKDPDMLQLLVDLDPLTEMFMAKRKMDFEAAQNKENPTDPTLYSKQEYQDTYIRREGEMLDEKRRLAKRPASADEWYNYLRDAWMTNAEIIVTIKSLVAAAMKSK